MIDGDRSFARGVIVGVGASAVLVQIWLAVELAPMRAMYGEFRAELPALTALVISPYWLWGVPGLGAIGVAALVRRRTAPLATYVLVIAALVLLTAVTWRWANAPLHDLAGGIR